MLVFECFYIQACSAIMELTSSWMSSVKKEGDKFESRPNSMQWLGIEVVDENGVGRSSPTSLSSSTSRVDVDKTSKTITASKTVRSTGQLFCHRQTSCSVQKNKSKRNCSRTKIEFLKLLLQCFQLSLLMLMCFMLLLNTITKATLFNSYSIIAQVLVMALSCSAPFSSIPRRL